MPLFSLADLPYSMGNSVTFSASFSSSRISRSQMFYKIGDQRRTQDISWIGYFIVLSLNIHVNKNSFIPFMALKTLLTALLSVHFSLNSSWIRKLRFLFGECALISTLTSVCSIYFYTIFLYIKYFWPFPIFFLNSYQ